MTTVVDFRLTPNFSQSVGLYYEHLWIAIAESYPEEKFIFLVEVKGLPAPIHNNIFYRLVKKTSFAWLDRKRIIKVLNEVHADNFVSLFDQQWVISHPTAEKFTGNYMTTPSVRLFFSEYHKQHAPVADKNAATPHVIKPAIQQVTFSLSWSETESIKTTYSGGRDFFLFVGDIDEKHHLLELLKAFSEFKKWQQSNMQLLIVGFRTSWTEIFEDKLASYKYQNDIVILADLSEMEIGKLVAAAYALLYPSENQVFPLTMVRALQTGVAVCASDIPVNREITGSAAWFDNNNLQESLASALKLLYTDENYKQEMVLKLKEQASNYNWQQMVGNVGQILTQR